MVQADAPIRTFHQVHPAGFLSRFVAFMIDLVIISLAVFFVISGVNLIRNFFDIHMLFSRIFGNDANLIAVLEQIVVLATALSCLLFSFAYFIFFWMLVGFTPGKAIMGLQIVRPNGEPLTGRRALVRLIGYWVSAIPFFLGYVWVLFDEHRQGWHDKMAGTYVVYVREINNDVKTSVAKD